MSIDNLIDKLTDEGVKKPLPSPYLQTLYWFVPTSVFMAVVMYFFHVRPDIHEKINNPIFVIELIALLLVVLLFTIVAFYYSRPDLYQKKWMVWVSFIILPLPIIMAYMGADGVLTKARFAESFHNHMGMQCATCITLFTIPPVIALFSMLKFGVSTHPGKAGLFAAIASTTFSYAMLRIHEPNDNPAHILVWHIFPVIMIAMISMLAGRFFLKWKK